MAGQFADPSVSSDRVAGLAGMLEGRTDYVAVCNDGRSTHVSARRSRSSGEQQVDRILELVMRVGFAQIRGA